MSMITNNNYIDCEILAPAGSYECMIGAFNAGADAVYVGGSMFGARAYACNFDGEELVSAINYAHLRGKKLYLTVNTLLKPDEIENHLIQYLAPFYEAGLDAVIVQDLGVLTRIKKNFPKLNIHASTQMTVTGVNFAKELKSLGVTRIVTERELSLTEIREIYDATGLEIESFVHGALCYCYSGQCLLSSVIGGRSGNRGRCAQPCRLNYNLYNESIKVNHKNERYLLSPKDMCTLPILPEILQAGVYSLKIEGRMKKPEYVAGVTAAYRKYVDMIKKYSGRQGQVNFLKEAFSVSEKDVEELKEIYNRGGFTDGFYTRQNGREMMSLYKPNHYGVKAGVITGISKNTISIKAIKDIDESDILEVNLKNNTSLPIDIKRSIKAGNTVEIKNTFKSLKSVDSLYEKEIFRTRNNKLIEDIEKNIINKKLNVPVKGSITIKHGVPITLRAELSIKDSDNKILIIAAMAKGDMPQKAENKPADIDTVLKQLRKTGNTDFIFTDIEADIDNGLFVPVSSLNSLRRDCLSQLYSKVTESFNRTYDKNCLKDNEPCIASVKNGKNRNEKPVIECVVSNFNQLNAVLEKEFTDNVGLELGSFSYDDILRGAKCVKDSGKKAYIALPYICRSRAINDFKRNIHIFKESDIYGLIVRNYEEYIFFAKLFRDMGIKKHFIFDSNIYMFNKDTINYVKELTAEYNDSAVFSIPYELNEKEIKSLDEQGMRIEIYGYIPVMITAGCVKKTTGCCDKITGSTYFLKDRLNNNMRVISNCRYCYNIILNSVPLYLGNNIKELKALKPHIYSARFTVEGKEETDCVLDSLEKALKGDNESLNTDYTRGHFRRGVI